MNDPILENRLVETLKLKGFVYSRYVDDIAITAKRSMTNGEKTKTVALVNRFVRGKGFKVRHKKTLISGPRDTKTITGVKIGKMNNNVPKGYIDSVFCEIKQYRLTNSVCEKRNASLLGKINYVGQFNAKQAYRLKTILEA